MPATKQQWEQVEVERSHQEALHTPDAELIADEQQVARYLQPPADTAYPLEYAFALLGDVAGRKVLDLGCSNGGNSLLLARRGAHVVGVDISQSLIQLARRRFELNGLSGAAVFMVGSGHDLPLQDSSVDVVFGIAVLHHLDLEMARREVLRVLRPGGRAIFQEPVRDSRVLRAVRKAIPYRSPDVSPFERPLTSAELRQFSSPFTTEAARAFSLPFVNVTKAFGFLQRHVARAHRIDAAILRRFPVLTPLSGVRVVGLSKKAS